MAGMAPFQVKERRFWEKFKLNAILGLGSNIGDKAENIRTALRLLSAEGDIAVVRVSKFYRTAPWGVTDQDWFVNACAVVSTRLSAVELLRRCLGIEAEMKRVRERHWGPRIIDVDVLTFGEETSDTAELKLPHPRITERGFVLVPFAEIAPDTIINGRSIGAWRDAIDTSDDVVEL